MEIDALGGGGGGFFHFREVADGEDLVAAKGDGFRVGIQRVGGKDFGVEEDPVGNGPLGPKRARGENECCEEEKKYGTARELSQGLAFPKKAE